MLKHIRQNSLTSFRYSVADEEKEFYAFRQVGNVLERDQRPEELFVMYGEEDNKFFLLTRGQGLA